MKKSNGNKPQRMNKVEFLAHWKALRSRAIHMRPIAYKHTGSTYGEDSIRLTGSREFCDAVLSQLKDLLRYEAATTRLQVVYSEVVDRETKEPTGDWSVYIQVHERGPQAAMVNIVFGGLT